MSCTYGSAPVRLRESERYVAFFSLVILNLVATSLVRAQAAMVCAFLFSKQLTCHHFQM